MESRTSRFSNRQAQRKIIEQSFTPAAILSNRLSGLIVFGNKIRLYIDPNDNKNRIDFSGDLCYTCIIGIVFSATFFIN